MPEIPKSRLKAIVSEIIRGFSVISWQGQSVFVKHLTYLESSNSDAVYDENLNRASNNDIQKLDEREKTIIEHELWSEKQNREINELKSYIDNLKTTKKQFFRSLDIERIIKQIDENEKKLEKILTDKMNIIGLTAESFAAKKLNEFYIFNSAYKNESLQEKLFTEDEFNELDDNQISKLVDTYNSSITLFNPQNLKKATLSGGFLNVFYLCNDDPYTFFGRPVIDLSFYQIELFSYGKYFKSLLSNSKNKPPDEVLEDPDKLIEWYDANNNAERELSKDSDPNTVSKSLVGLSSKDRKQLGLEQKHGVDLIEEAKKKGGTLNFQEIIKLQKD